MGSEYDYINEHMGGHDEDGLPNFMKGIEADWRREFARNNRSRWNDENNSDEVIVSDNVMISMNKSKASYILENLLERINLEDQTLTITKTELNAVS